MEAEDIEVSLLLEGIYQKYGYDFRKYSKASIKRRIKHLLAKTEASNISALTHELLHCPDQFTLALPELTVTTSEMFRDPVFFRCLRTQLVPILKTYPNPKIWIAGCSTGEEIYSIAIVLHETGLLDSTTIFATDINKLALSSAKSGIYPAENITGIMNRYHQSGGSMPFSNYFHAGYGAIRVEGFLKKNIVFAEHNLSTDSHFIKAQAVFCRNVLIYFDRDLQERVISLFADSLDRGGFLCLGSKESIDFLEVRARFRDFDSINRIYRLPVPGAPSSKEMLI